MPSTAKLFQNGQSQAVRLPKEFRFENLKEVGNSIVLTPSNLNVWDSFFENLNSFKEQIQREQPSIQQRDNFE